MLEIRVTLEAPALAAAVDNLAVAIANRQTHAPAAAVQQNAAPAAPVQQPPAAPVAPTAAPTVAQTGPRATAPGSAPTAAPSYTKEQLQLAGGNLITAHPEKMPELMGLLQRFGVANVTALPEEQIGAFATAMREIGAVI